MSALLQCLTTVTNDNVNYVCTSHTVFEIQLIAIFMHPAVTLTL